MVDVEICPICEDRLTEKESDMLLTMAYVQVKPEQWSISSPFTNALSYDLEQKGMIVTHETLDDIYFTVKMRPCLVETSRFENAQEVHETFKCYFLCGNFHNHRIKIEGK